MKRLLSILIILSLFAPDISLATISFGTAGAAVTGSNSLSVPYPASISSGDLLVLLVGSVYTGKVSTTPSGFTAPTPYFTLNASDLSTVSVYYRVANGTESGNLSVTISGGSPTSSIGIMLRYTCSTNCTWSTSAVGATDTTAGTSWSAATTTDPGVTAGDWVVVASATQLDVTASAEAITQTGITQGTVTERNDSNIPGGDPFSFIVSDHVADSGTSSAGPTYTMTITNGGNDGATHFLRIREIAGVVTAIVYVKARGNVKIRGGVKYR